MPTSNADVLSLIAQAHDENWKNSDLSGMGLTELPMAYGRSETIELCALTELKTWILGKEEPGDERMVSMCQRRS